MGREYDQVANFVPNPIPAILLLKEPLETLRADVRGYIARENPSRAFSSDRL